MKDRHPLTLDLNNLFHPAISDGPKLLNDVEKNFAEIHAGILTLKQTGHLPYSQLPSDDILRGNVKAAAAKYKDVKNVVVLGIGGSALGPSSVYLALYGAYANLIRSDKRLFVLDNIEPDTMNETIDLVKDEPTLYVVISKSGNTSETLSQYLFLQKKVPNLSRENLFIITDPNNGFLHDLVNEKGYDGLPVPTGVGGRFSVFTSVGLFPLAVCGVDIDALLDGAEHMENYCRQGVLAQNPAALLAFTLYEWIENKKMSQVVLMPYADRLRLVSDWFAQLWGESLGKAQNLKGEIVHTGSTPIKSLGVTDQHSQLQLYLDGPRDKVVLFVDVDEFDQEGLLGQSEIQDDRIEFLNEKKLAELLLSEKLATEESLRENDRANATIKMTKINEYQIGQLYQMFMNVIPYAGALWDINPFDQPAVERIKKFTFGLMGRKGFEDYKVKLDSQKKDENFIFTSV